jgi:predicted protein tyrosine phosphatase
MRILVICNQNLNRSKTAEDLLKGKFDVRSRGIYRNVVQGGDLAWADLVIVMEEEQQQELGRRFPKQYLQKKFINFDVPDVYYRDQPELIELLQEKIEQIFEP